MSDEAMRLARLLMQKAAATLLQQKSASLFSIKHGRFSDFEGALGEVKRALSPYCHIRLMNQNARCALLYVYQPDLLLRGLKLPAVRRFLLSCGYQEDALEACARAQVQGCEKRCALCQRQASSVHLEMLLDHLSARFDHLYCPHEVGIFLDYPLRDVLGFIRFEGKRAKCIGCWKVYSDPEEAKRRFAKYREAEHLVQAKIADEVNPMHGLLKLYSERNLNDAYSVEEALLQLG